MKPSNRPFPANRTTPSSNSFFSDPLHLPYTFPLLAERTPVQSSVRYLLVVLICWCCLGPAFANSEPRALYWVSFTDKAESPYSLILPQQFLSPRAIARRAAQGIALDEKDLPVTPKYLEALRAQGAHVRYASRWFNAAVIDAEEEVISKIEALAMVDKVEYVGKYYEPRKSKKKKPPKFDKDYEKIDLPYGYSDHQVRMLQGQALHQLGFAGQGKLVAVLDGGFIEVDRSPFFHQLRETGQLKNGRDFVDIDANVFEASTHGTMVLSTMGANLPGLYVGTAPGAAYVCIKTEDTRGEYRIEECNWIAGAEYADSLGADVINSSLGYTTFSDTSMNYRYSDLNGQTSRASRAADIAFSKGIVVVNSMGNSGNDPWQYLGVPADGVNVLAIGATDYLGNRATFSSLGPSADNRIKPNVSAMGQNLAVASIKGYDVISSNGTSFSSPLIAGMVASLWSALPHYDQQQIFELVQTSGHKFPEADSELGFGIPDFLQAFLRETVALNLLYLDAYELLMVKPPHEKTWRILLASDPQQQSEVTVKNVLDEVVWSERISTPREGELWIGKITDSSQWPPGLYSAELRRGEKRQHIIFRVGE